MPTPLLVAVLLAACGRPELALPATARPAVPFSGASRAGSTPFDAEATFEALCTSCHEVGEPGVDYVIEGACCAIVAHPAAAVTAADPENLIRPVNFSDPEYWASPEPTDDYLAAVITHGGAAMGLHDLMPAWGDELDPEEVAALVAHIRSLRPRSAQ